MKRTQTTPQVERLEDRHSPAVFTVTNALDSGPGSLRQALLDANANGGPDSVLFNVPRSAAGWEDVDATLPGGDPDTDTLFIRLLSQLPVLTDASGGTTVDGRSQAIFSGDTNPFGPEIALNGSNIPTKNGIGMNSGNNRLFGVNVQGFSSGFGVFLGHSPGNWVAGCYLGTDPTGTRAQANVVGVLAAFASTNATIGTNADGVDDLLERNVISGNSESGVSLLHDGTSGHVVAGNFIGTDRTGTTAIPNGFNGVNIRDGARNNRIGTNGDGVRDDVERNVISGNGSAIWVWNAEVPTAVTTGNVIAGNSIGTNAAGTAALANGRGVVLVAGPRLTRVGSDGSNDAFNGNERNVISGNSGSGIEVFAADTTVAGNSIGTNAAGTAAIPNGLRGIEGAEAPNLRVGTNADGVADEAEGNVISGNLATGLRLDGASTADGVIAGNFIGVSADGTRALGNGGNGVQLRRQVGRMTVGGSTAAARNVIAGNAAAGVLLENGFTRQNVVAGNVIGTNASGSMAIPNGTHGVRIESGAADNVVVDNLISGNTGDGISLAGTGNGLPPGAVAAYSYESNLNDFFGGNHPSATNAINYIPGRFGLAVT